MERPAARVRTARTRSSGPHRVKAREQALASADPTHHRLRVRELAESAAYSFRCRQRSEAIGHLEDLLVSRCPRESEHGFGGEESPEPSWAHRPNAGCLHANACGRPG